VTITETERPSTTPTVKLPDHLAPPAPMPSNGSDGPANRSPVVLVAIWVAVILLSLWLVLYFLEPLFQQRNQEQLLRRYRSSISSSANEVNGLAGISTPTKAPSPGSPVAVLEVGGIQLQQIVVEGVGPSQTQLGPGHVPGTAGPGQPGNSVVVARRATFGAPFGKIGQLHEGDMILVTTTQGQSVYKVSTVEEKTIRVPKSAGGASTTATTPTTAAPGDAGASPDASVVTEVVDRDTLYGKTTDDRLTLVTSGDANPLNSSRALIVTATLEGRPFKPTPQGGRVDSETGTRGDPGAWAALILAVQAFVLTGVAAVLLYRRSSMRVAYLLTVPPFIAFAILLAESVSRLLPAWI
jgi:sortase A